MNFSQCRSILLIVISILAISTSPTILFAAPVETVTNTNDAGPGSLRQAIADVDPGGEITFNIPGAAPHTITLASSLIIDKPMTITGPGSDVLTLDTGGNEFVIFIVDDADGSTKHSVTISGLTTDPGLIFTVSIFNQEDLTLNHMVVLRGLFGLFNDGSLSALDLAPTLTVNDSRIAMSLSTGIVNLGGEAVSAPGGIVEINNSTLFGNFEFGIFNAGSVFDSAQGGEVTINNSTITGNFQGVLNDGGNAPNSIGCTMTINNSTIADNAGDGIQNNGGTDAAGTGGMLTVNNSTISGNGFNGIINFDLGNGNVPTAQVNNSIVANNIGEDCSNGGLGIFTGTGANFDTDGLCAAQSPSFTQVTPMELNLGPLQDNGGPTDTIALISPSVAIDAATSCPPPSEDQRHFPRPFGIGCDSGAFEAQPIGAITLNKESIPPGGTVFEFQGIGFPDGCDLQGSFVMNAGESFSCILPATQYSIHETLQPDSGVNISCSEEPESITFNSVTLNIDEGDDVTCTFTNDERPLILNPIIPAIASNINTISAESASSNGSVAFIWGFMHGSTIVNGPSCNGLELGIKNPRLLSIVNASPAGIAEYIFFITLIGDFEIAVLVQAVDVPTCRYSTVLEQIIRKQ